MSTITREQLITQAQENVAQWRDAMQHNVNTEYAAIRLLLAEIALASLKAEPVAWTDEQELRDVDKFGCAYLFTVNPITPNADRRRVNNLYTVPPAPVAAPDDEQCKPHPVMAVKGELGFLDHFERIISERDEDIDIGQLGSSNYEALTLAALDAFRAAMQHDSENAESPPSNSPVIPDGWVACSERMPEQYDYEIWTYSPTKGVNHSLGYDGHARAFSDGEYYSTIDDVTHWMPITRPEAPQQEVR